MQLHHRPGRGGLLVQSPQEEPYSAANDVTEFRIKRLFATVHLVAFGTKLRFECSLSATLRRLYGSTV